jgi:hypothetical protein
MIRRLLVLIAAAIVAAHTSTLSPAAAIPATQTVAVYTYDCQHCSAQTASMTTERGPPPADEPLTRYADAVDRWSHGASRRPNGPIPP